MGALSKRLPIIILNRVCLSTLCGRVKCYQSTNSKQVQVLKKLNLVNNVKHKTIHLNSPLPGRVEDMPTPIELQHRGDYFYVPLGGYHRASLKYQIVNGVMVIKHTFVPTFAGGRGIGMVLARAALEYAEEMGYKVKVECKYVQHYIDKYAPEFQKLVVDEVPEV